MSDKQNASSAVASNAELLDSYAVSQLILRERLARETNDPDTADTCFLPDAIVEVSWFKGTGAQFVDTARQRIAAGIVPNAVYFDSLGPALVTVNKDRAIADSPAAVHTYIMLDGVEASMTSYTRLLWRARKVNGEWRLAGLHAYYIRDALMACNPVEIPQIDVKKLANYRHSYRHLSYVLEAGGRPLRNDLPGVDRPDLVKQLRADERAWLEQI